MQEPFHSRRLGDLIIPPLEENSSDTICVAERGLKNFIGDLEHSSYTGCIKAISQRLQSRSTILLFHGQVVGCLYSNKNSSFSGGIEKSLMLALADLRADDTTVLLYQVPISILVPISSLFLGNAVDRSDNYDARDFIEYILNWNLEKKLSACIVVTTSQTRCLLFVYNGAFSGAFYVEAQTLIEKLDLVYELFENNAPSVEASVLSPSLLFGEYGLSLSEFMEKVDNRSQQDG